MGFPLRVVGLGPRGGALDGELPEDVVRDGAEREDDARVAVQLMVGLRRAGCVVG